MKRVILAGAIVVSVVLGATAAEATSKPRPFMASSVVMPNRLVMRGIR